MTRAASSPSASRHPARMRAATSLVMMTAIVLAASVCAWNTSQAPEPVTWLQPDKTVDRAIDGTAHRYAIALAAGQYASVVIEHRGSDLVAQLRKAGGAANVLLEADARQQRDVMEFTAVEGGAFELRISPKYPLRPTGAYQLRVGELHASTAADRLLYEARKQLSRSREQYRAGAYAPALSAAERALHEVEKALGPDHPETAGALSAVALVCAARNEYDRAETAYRRALAIREKTFGSDDPAVADVLDALAQDETAKARYEEAERLANRALAIRERQLGSDHPLVAESLGTLADMYSAKRNYRTAEGFAERAIELAGRSYSADDLSYVAFMARLGRVETYLGNYVRAEDLLSRASNTTERMAGHQSMAFADSTMNLALLYLLRAADNVKSEELYRRALAMKEPLLGENHLDIATILHGLGLLSYRRGDYDTAEAYETRELAIRERILGQSHPLVTQTVNNLGLVYWKRHELGKAAAFFQRAVDISERFYGPDGADVAPPLGNLGIIQKEAGDYAAAETSYKRALGIEEATLGKQHPLLRVTIESLGILYRDKGDYASAEPMFRRAVDITEHSLGPDHPDLARHLVNLAQMYAAESDSADALKCWLQVSAIDEKGLPLNLTIGSERQKLAYFEPFMPRLERIVSFHVLQDPDDPQARDLAAATLLQRKGRVLDAMADTLGVLRKRANAADLSVFDRLNAVTAQLASSVLNGPQRVPLAEHQQRIRALAQQRDALEADVSRRTAGYYERAEPVKLSSIKAAIPADAALLEFGIYRPYDPATKSESDKQYGDPRYVVYVIRNRDETRWTDLGSTREIDDAIAAFRDAMRDPARADARSRARVLDRKVMQPIRALTGDATHLLISPEGQLSLVPFEALVDEEHRYLIERYAISYLTSGRDLLRMQIARDSKSPPLIIADPYFGEPPPRGAAGRKAVRTTISAPLAARRSLVSARDRSRVYFAPLPGTLAEARAIHALFPEATMLTGRHASEALLKRVEGPAILHIATHGFFLQDAAIRNPLLRSGIGLSGANLNKSSGEDGILTALEASSLNLWGTRLVTLSACDTGLGEIRNGEGVYGLRRGFLLAGAETLVMSLWPVSDYVTREIMTAYYTGLKRGLGRGEALRRAQLAMLARKNRRHPFYWASFIQVGEWASLDGRR